MKNLLFAFLLLPVLLGAQSEPLSDTAGCLLVGYGTDFNGRFSVTRSTAAYLYLYDLVKAAFDRGEKVEVEISREILQAAAPKTA